MAKQRFLNNFTSIFIAAVKDAPSSGTPETELDYGVLRISDGAAGSLINPTDGDYYLLTAFKRSGSVESNIEVMRVTGVNNATPGECRITVQRAQEGTSAKAFVSGDCLSLRITKGTAENFAQPADMAQKVDKVAGKGGVGLDNVDNTSDANKPVSTAQAAAISASTATNIHAATSKATPVDADELGLSDSAASWGLKKLTFANLKAWIAGLFVSRTNAQVDGNIYVTGMMGVGIANPQFPMQVPGVSSIANNGNKRVFNSIANNTDWLRLCSFVGSNVPSYVRFVLGSAQLHTEFLVELSNGAGGDAMRVKVTLLCHYEYYNRYPMEWRIVPVGTNQPGHLDIRFGNSAQQVEYQIFELENVSALSANSASRVAFPCTNVGSASAGFGLKIGTNSGFSYLEFTIFQAKYKRTNLSMVDSTGVIPVNTVVV